MKNVFGKDIKFKDFSKKTSWFKQKFFSHSKHEGYSGLVNDVLNNLEQRLIWSKYDF